MRKMVLNRSLCLPTSRLWALGIALFILFVDSLSKWAVHHLLPPMSQFPPIYPYGGIAVFENFFGIEFSISHATNRGAAWGMFADYSSLLLAFRIALVLGLTAYVALSERMPERRIPLALVLAGAVGNIIDSFLYGHVVDMFHFVFWGYDYPVFNIADSAIFVGIALLLVLSWLNTDPCQKKREERGSL